MNLINVYQSDSREILYELLQEREPNQNISHKEMPDFYQHVKFVDSHPYAAWYLIEVDKIVGSVYLTEHDEIGVFLFDKFKGKGYGSEAIRLLMEKHKRPRYLAHINPKNTASINLFRKLEFRHIQETFEYES